MQNNVLIVIGCILLLLLPVAAIGSKKVFDNSKASAEWPSTQGTIVYSQLEAHVDPRKAKAKVRYQFSINDRSYSGDRIRFVDTTGNGKSIQQGVVDTYHVGKQVDVFYQPDKPSNCVLVRGGGVFAFLIFIPLLLLLGLGGYLLTAGIQGKKKAIAQKKRKPTRKPMRPNGEVSWGINGFSHREIEEIRESTNCSDPGFLRLDQDMLNRFHPDWYAGGLSGILRITRELFGKPDPRLLVKRQLLCAQRAPALVVCTDPFYVAAYSEEFDGIVMLGFHAQQVPPQFRKVGTKLVTLNFDYSIKFGPLAEDIVPGEDAWDGWTNFLPLIGDFLSTETERLDQLREDIRPELWRRATDCAKHYDYRSRGVRDGRPGFAAQPGSRNHIWRMIDRGF